MTGFVNVFDTFLSDYFGVNLPDVGITDLFEIIIIAFFIYEFLVWIKNTRVWMLFRGILVVLIFFSAAALFQMNTILWIGEKLVSVGVVALIVVFQPELRKVLESLGRKSFSKTFQGFSFNMVKPSIKRFSDNTIVSLVTSCYEMGAVKTGALIVVENDMLLTEYEKTGIPLDSIVTRQLLINIFEKNTPLHDGAIIVRGDRVTAATCYLPLSDNMGISKDLGTRHRAALGLSEVSDALIIIVSEETGNVSIARDGQLIHAISEEQLIASLKRLQTPGSDEVSIIEDDQIFDNENFVMAPIPEGEEVSKPKRSSKGRKSKKNKEVSNEG